MLYLLQFCTAESECTESGKKVRKKENEAETTQKKKYLEETKIENTVC